MNESTIYRCNQKNASSHFVGPADAKYMVVLLGPARAGIFSLLFCLFSLARPEHVLMGHCFPVVPLFVTPSGYA